MKNKIKELEAELKKFKERYNHMSTEFAQTKAGSAYGESIMIFNARFTYQ